MLSSRLVGRIKSQFLKNFILGDLFSVFLSGRAGQVSDLRTFALFRDVA